MYISPLFLFLVLLWTSNSKDNQVDAPDCGEFFGDPPDINFR